MKKEGAQIINLLGRKQSAEGDGPQTVSEMAVDMEFLHAGESSPEQAGHED